MHFRNRAFSLLLVLLLALASLPAANADVQPAALPTAGDYVIRIDGGYVEDHIETVGGKDCLRVDLFLNGVTSERLLSSISFRLLYDANQLTYVKHQAPGGSMSVVNANEAGQIRYAFASASGTLLNENTPLLTLWFSLSETLREGAQIRFAFAEAIKSDSVCAADTLHSEKRSVGARLNPFGLGVLYGDANCDGRITAADASLVLRALIGSAALSARGEKNAKVDGTDALTASDAALILRSIVGLTARYPVEG